MFSGATSFNQDIQSWGVSSVTDMSRMFEEAAKFNQDISGWDVSSVNNMEGMFFEARSFNQDVEDWNVSNVTNMFSMFSGATSFNQDIQSWDVSGVTDMGDMFKEAIRFNQDISGWNVSSVISMSGMFKEAIQFNRGLSDWDVSKVSDMEEMFMNTINFNQNLGGWDLANISNMNNIFRFCGLSCENYSACLIGWADNQQTADNVELGAVGMFYGKYAEDARAKLLSKSWIIQGDWEGSCTVSTDRPTPSDISLYPNPAANRIWLDIQEPMQYGILNSRGQQIQQGTTHGTINVSQLPKSIYFVRILDSEGRTVLVEKVVKN